MLSQDDWPKGRSRLEKDFAVSQIEEIVRWQEEFRWLADLGILAPRAVHFGCGTGEALLGLMEAVQAESGAGIDEDPNALLIARDRLLRLKWDLKKFWARLNDSDSLPAREFAWWNREVPRYLKEKLLDEDFLMDFRVGRLPFDDPLEESGYDIAMTYFLLCDIWWDKSLEDPEHQTRVALGRMKRNLRQGGYLAIVEWTQRRFEPDLDFPLLFDQVDLRLLYKESFQVDSSQGKGVAARYLCQKAV